MKIKDFELLSIISGAIGFLGFVITASLSVFGEMLAFSFGIGIIVLIVRRSILKVKKKIEEKRQAV